MTSPDQPMAATHRDLAQMVARNEFRSDLYYRLNVFPVLILPLRELREDIHQLVLHFAEVFARVALHRTAASSRLWS
jgi:formate hydrogenlyase transcriptional activator